MRQLRGCATADDELSVSIDGLVADRPTAPGVPTRSRLRAYVCDAGCAAPELRTCPATEDAARGDVDEAEATTSPC
jgi:hypothetical protein